MYYPIKGDPAFIETVTRSEAWTLDGGQVVVKIAGRTGCVAVEHIRPYGTEPDDYEKLKKLVEYAINHLACGYTSNNAHQAAIRYLRRGLDRVEQGAGVRRQVGG